MRTHAHDREHQHGHGHSHGRIAGLLREVLVPHTHDSAGSIDDAVRSSRLGIRAVKVSLVVLLATTLLQCVVVAVSGSVALLADTVHNFSDALTAVPLWIAFVLGRRAPTARHTYGFGRAEDVAGLFIVLVVAASAVVAAWQSLDRLLHPQPLQNLGWVVIAGVIGFIGNEAVALHRIRVGRRIGSAALVADGLHARTDGFTSLAVVAGAVGALLGFPLADPIVGLLISALILVVLIGTVRSIGSRMMDAVDHDVRDRAEAALRGVDGVRDVPELQLRWAGHRLQGDAALLVDDVPLSATVGMRRAAEQGLADALPRLDVMRIRFVTEPQRAP